MAPPAGGERPSPRRLVVPGLFVLALFVFLFLRLPGGTDGTDGEGPEVDARAHVGSAFGTSFSVRWLGPGSEEVVAAAVKEVVDRVNGSMSTYHPNSELSRFNRLESTETVTVSAELSGLLEEAAALHALTAGAFDPTVGPLVEAWGFGPEATVDPPTEDALEAARAEVGLDGLAIDGRSVRKKRPGLELDLSAIAKGYAVDEVSRALETAGIENHLVEIGGEVRARGRGPRGVWTVGIERPVPGSKKDIFEVVPLSGAALATSGNYRNFVTVDGQRITHIIDPRTGQPVDHGLGSVSVVHERCATADALATALYVLGADAGVAWAESKGIAAVFLTPKGEGVDRRATSAYRTLRRGASPSGHPSSSDPSSSEPSSSEPSSPEPSSSEERE